jgi:putative ABC transport system permease protein
MRALVAWRILTHEVARSLLAILGVFAAIVLVFMQLGFYSSVPLGSMFIYSAMNFDIAITSRDYAFQVRPHYFPRRRLYQALALPEVASAVPFYQGYAQWLNAEDRKIRDIFIMGVDPDKGVFNVPGIRAKADALKAADVLIVDTMSRPAYGHRHTGTAVEINERKMTIVGDYTLGTGFLGLGIMVVSDINFVRVFPKKNLDQVSVGLIRLKPGADANAVAQKLRAAMPDDARVFTRAEFTAHEQGYWLNATSTGLVFGFGTAVAGIVGLAILFQTLSTMILRNLPEYAVLKAIGYTDRYLTEIVVNQAVLIVSVAFVPAVIATYGLYDVARDATKLSIFMTTPRIVVVLATTLAASIAGGILTNRVLKRADPVDLF